MGKEDEIREIAYTIWEEEGCCDGRDFDHWLRAEAIWRSKQKPGYHDGEITTETVTYPKDGQETAIGEVEIRAINTGQEKSSKSRQAAKPAPRHGTKKRK
jgi:hypothetical protein